LAWFFLTGNEKPDGSSSASSFKSNSNPHLVKNKDTKDSSTMDLEQAPDDALMEFHYFHQEARAHLPSKASSDVNHPPELVVNPQREKKRHKKKKMSNATIVRAQPSVVQMDSAKEELLCDSSSSKRLDIFAAFHRVVVLVNLRFLWTILFCLQAVLNPRFIIAWNGGERLVFAYVLISIKTHSFFSRSCFVSLSICILPSLFMGHSILVHWFIFVIVLKSIFSVAGLSPASIISNHDDDDEKCNSPQHIHHHIHHHHHHHHHQVQSNETTSQGEIAPQVDIRIEDKIAPRRKQLRVQC